MQARENGGLNWGDGHEEGKTWSKLDTVFTASS